MRIACFSFYYACGYNAEGLVTAKWVDALRSAGHDIEVFSFSVDQSKYQPRLRRAIQTVIKYRCITAAYFVEVSRYVPTAVADFLACHSVRRFDCIVSRFEPTHSCVAGYYAAAASNIPWIVNVNDPIPRCCRIRRSPFGFKDYDLNGFNRRWAVKTLKFADMLVLPSFRLLEYVRRYAEGELGVRLPDARVIPHVGGSVHPRRLGLRGAKHKKSGSILVRHVGFLSRERDLSTLVKALIAADLRLADTTIRLEFVGDCRQKHTAIRELRDLRLNHIEVDLRGVVEPDEAAALIEEADWGLLIEQPLQTGIFLPSKFCDYVVLGTPVFAITNADSEVADYMDHYACGVRVTHGDIDGCIEALLRIAGGDPPQTMLAAKQFEQVNIASQWSRTLDVLVRNHDRVLTLGKS